MNIAVLIPCYNAERFLRDTLESLFAQTIPVSIWCCNDGSTDGTLAILREYEKKGIHVISQENRGLSAAHDCLLNALSPDIEAIGFVDADDYVHPRMFELLSKALSETGADVAEGGIVPVPRSARPLEGLDVPANPVVTVTTDMRSGRWINVVNKLYRRAPIADIRFRRGLAYEEDNFFNQEVNERVTKKAIVDASFYAYRNNPGSETTLRNFHKYVDSCYERVRLSHEVLKHLRRKELAKEVYRMLIRKNLRKNRDAVERRKIFMELGPRLVVLERDWGFDPRPMPLIPRLAYIATKGGHYHVARLLAVLT